MNNIRAQQNLGLAGTLTMAGGMATVAGIYASSYSIPLFIPALIAHVGLPALGVGPSLTGTVVTIAAIIPSVVAVIGIALVILGSLGVIAGFALGCFTCCTM